MKKMTFNLFSRFILWLKKIFYICPKAEYGEEKPPEIPPEEGPVEAKSPEEKTLEVPLENIIETESQIGHPEEEAKTKTQKPYKKKIPTEERKKEHRKPSEDEKKPASPKQRKEIDLGRRPAKRTKTGKPPHPNEEDKVSKEREVTTRVESPYVEIDLDEAKVFFTIPKQQFKASTISNIPQQLHYKLELNGKEQSISIKVSSDDQGTVKVEEKRIELEEPLKSFQVVFPDELQGEIKTYSYNHNNTNLYVFISIGNNRGRMHYLYDKEGNINPLPNRMVWLLLHEDFKFEIESNYLTEEIWIWEKYQPFRINLKEMNELVIKNTKTGKEYKLSCEPTFSIEGLVIEDDFKDQMPLLIGETLKIKAPRENPFGLTVWIQNKVVGYQIVTDNWNGAEPLTLKLPDDIPCECGEFQVDICQQDTRIPDETLFFRWLPFIELDYPKELIIPDPRQGHKSEFINVKVSGEGWMLNYGADREIEPIESNSYQIELLPEEDIVNFSITKKGKPETGIRIQITIPRLKWKTSKQEVWDGRFQRIKRKELIQGQELELSVKPNDFRGKYDISAFLEEDGQRREGPVEFKRKGGLYILGLNEFYDTIDYYKNELTLRIEICKASNDRILGSVELIRFESKSQDHLKKITSPKQIPKEETIPLSLVRRDQAIVKCPGKVSQKRKGKGFSRREIIAAGIDINNIRCLTVPFDKRRKTLHDWNVKTLQSIIRSDEHAH